MIKEIRFNGFTAQPSDYDCTDGDLAAAINLIPEDGAINPIAPPVRILSLSKPGERVLLIHAVPGQKNYIFLRPDHDGAFSIYWQALSDSASDSSAATLIASASGFRDLAAFGNTLVLASDAGLLYILWNNGAYSLLGDRPPFVSIDFSLYKVDTLQDSEKITIPARCTAYWRTRHTGDDATDAERAKLTQSAMGLLLPHIADITSRGYFYMPFFVRYAFRLFDGSYFWHSAPLLLLPNILPPIINYKDDGSTPSSADETGEATITLDVPYFALAHRILPDGLAALDNWRDIIAGIDVFISAPVYTYRQSEIVPKSITISRRDLLAEISGDRHWNDAGTHPGWILNDNAFIGHYATAVNAPYIDHSVNAAPGADNVLASACLNIRPNPNFHSDITSTQLFYKVAQIDVADIKAMADMAPLKFTCDDLSNLTTRPALPDDFQSRARLLPSSLFVYNSRLSLAGLSIAPAEPLPIRSMMEFGNPAGISPSFVRITVWSRINGQRCFALHPGKAGNIADVWINPAANPPRFIFYPDASAYKMEIFVSDTQKFIIPLTPHDFLNGAYWYRGRDALSLSPMPENVEPEPDGLPSSALISSKIYTSEVNNPFIFPASGVVTVGNGNVFALSAAVKALSQGQFGQFPLYAFTDEGVWALAVSSTGAYSARQPITRDVIFPHAKPLQMDSAVLFATERGIMLLSGSQTQCITGLINSQAPFNVLRLPGMPALHALLGHSADTCIPTAPFLDFIAGCGMLYDYLHQRVIVYNPDYTYAYVYSLNSKAWGMMFSSIKSGINSYPNALAVSRDGSILNFSAMNCEESQGTLANPPAPTGLLVTRPLKLGLPDVFKTVQTVIQRGHFRKGHVRTALYGSRDLFNWHLVWSGKGARLRNFHGSPYKYFRLACLTSLSEGESLSASSFLFNPRLNDILR